ncbi:MAG: AAA family ATPase [bacterium]
MNKQKTIESIITYVSAGYPLIYLYTSEELKALEIIKQAAVNSSPRRNKIYIYDIAKGMYCIDDQDERLSIDNRTDILDAINFIEDSIDEPSFVIFKDIHKLLEDDKTVRAIKNCVYKNTDATVFVISPVLTIPKELEKESVTFDISLPERDEIKSIFEEFTEKDSYKFSETSKNKFIEALSGLSEFEIKNILNYCLVKDGDINENQLPIIVNQKRQLIKKGSVLELVSSFEKIGDVGGMNSLKKWIEKKKIIFDKLEEARNYGVDIPKGVLLFGMPGCGKSLIAKAISGYFGMPLLRLDMGLILGPYVGQSEENIRKAIKLAESIAPSTLWIDEVEKALVGVGRNGGASEVSTRIFGSILTWMQEKTKPVFVIATANNISGLPPEFMRKGRFDEIFFVDFPKGEEIKDIFKVHFNKRKKEDLINKLDLDKISSQIKDYSGADIEAVVKEAVEDSFINESEINTDILLNELKEFKPLSVTMKDEIAELKKIIEKFSCRNSR